MIRKIDEIENPPPLPAPRRRLLSDTIRRLKVIQSRHSDGIMVSAPNELYILVFALGGEPSYTSIGFTKRLVVVEQVLHIRFRQNHPPFRQTIYLYGPEPLLNLRTLAKGSIPLRQTNADASGPRPIICTNSAELHERMQNCNKETIMAIQDVLNEIEHLNDKEIVDLAYALLLQRDEPAGHEIQIHESAHPMVLRSLARNLVSYDGFRLHNDALSGGEANPQISFIENKESLFVPSCGLSLKTGSGNLALIAVAMRFLDSCGYGPGRRGQHLLAALASHYGYHRRRGKGNHGHLTPREMTASREIADELEARFHSQWPTICTRMEELGILKTNGNRCYITCGRIQISTSGQIIDIDEACSILRAEYLAISKLKREFLWGRN